MNFKTAKAYQEKLPLDPDRPRVVEVDGAGVVEWDKRQATGEVEITALDVLPRNGWYRLELRWPDKK